MDNFNNFVKCVGMSDWNFIEVFIVMFVVVKCCYYFINNVVYINKIYNNVWVIDVNRKIICYIVVESCNGIIIVWMILFFENVWEVVDKYFCFSFCWIFKY